MSEENNLQDFNDNMAALREQFGAGTYLVLHDGKPVLHGKNPERLGRKAIDAGFRSPTLFRIKPECKAPEDSERPTIRFAGGTRPKNDI